ncbi:hypothetical protein LTR17_009657 [Elasticomyces elasticus]|nr:hypothetical protein LTR17_009657 [Elasticomyces elasticus]
MSAQQDQKRSQSPEDNASFEVRDEKLNALSAKLNAKLQNPKPNKPETSCSEHDMPFPASDPIRADYKKQHEAFKHDNMAAQGVTRGSHEYAHPHQYRARHYP